MIPFGHRIEPDDGRPIPGAIFMRLPRRFATSLVVLSLALASAPSAQAPPAAQTPTPATAAAPNDTLAIGGDVPHPLTVTAAELKAWPRTKAVVEEEGRQVTYEGVALSEILVRAGAPLGPSLRGNSLASYVLATARDGYEVVFSLAEVDPAMTKGDVIVADLADGKPLFDYQGPLRIVAPHDSRPARSVRMLQRLDVVLLRK
jgi:hypothetical protein